MLHLPTRTPASSSSETRQATEEPNCVRTLCTQTNNFTRLPLLPGLETAVLKSVNVFTFFALTLPSPCRVVEEINKISPHFTPKIPPLIITAATEFFPRTGLSGIKCYVHLKKIVGRLNIFICISGYISCVID